MNLGSSVVGIIKTKPTAEFLSGCMCANDEEKAALLCADGGATDRHEEEEVIGQETAWGRRQQTQLLKRLFPMTMKLATTGEDGDESGDENGKKTEQQQLLEAREEASRKKKKVRVVVPYDEEKERARQDPSKRKTTQYQKTQHAQQTRKGNKQRAASPTLPLDPELPHCNRIVNILEKHLPSTVTAAAAGPTPTTSSSSPREQTAAATGKQRQRSPPHTVRLPLSPPHYAESGTHPPSATEVEEEGACSQAVFDVLEEEHLEQQGLKIEEAVDVLPTARMVNGFLFSATPLPHRETWPSAVAEGDEMGVVSRPRSHLYLTDEERQTREANDPNLMSPRRLQLYTRDGYVPLDERSTLARASGNAKKRLKQSFDPGFRGIEYYAPQEAEHRRRGGSARSSRPQTAPSVATHHSCCEGRKLASNAVAAAAPDPQRRSSPTAEHYLEPTVSAEVTASITKLDTLHKRGPLATVANVSLLTYGPEGAVHRRLVRAPPVVPTVPIPTVPTQPQIRPPSSSYCRRPATAPRAVTRTGLGISRGEAESVPPSIHLTATQSPMHHRTKSSSQDGLQGASSRASGLPRPPLRPSTAEVRTKPLLTATAIKKQRAATTSRSRTSGGFAFGKAHICGFDSTIPLL